MEERIASAIGQFNEAEALVALEPLHSGVDSGRIGSTAGHRRHGNTTGSVKTAAEGCTRRTMPAARIIAHRAIIIVEAPLAGPKILTFAHALSLRRPIPSLRRHARCENKRTCRPELHPVRHSVLNSCQRRPQLGSAVSMCALLRPNVAATSRSWLQQNNGTHQKTADFRPPHVTHNLNACAPQCSGGPGIGPGSPCLHASGFSDHVPVDGHDSPGASLQRMWEGAPQSTFSAGRSIETGVRGTGFVREKALRLPSPQGWNPMIEQDDSLQRWNPAGFGEGGYQALWRPDHSYTIRIINIMEPKSWDGPTKPAFQIMSCIMS